MIEDKGIILNEKKTQIVKLGSWFKFLKWRFKLTESGKVVIKPCKESIVRERRKLKKLKVKYDDGFIGFEEVRAQYDSWKGYISFGNSYRTIRNMDNLFNRLFAWPENGGSDGFTKVRNERTAI